MEHLVSKNTGHPERISHLSQEMNRQTLEQRAQDTCEQLSQRIGDIIFGFDIQHASHNTGEYTVNFYLDKTASEEDIKTTKEITADIKKPALSLAS